ncbi:hypothetical protein N7451_009492 [Penicillium sp. IBT 35674x]|nr:hypothetical protein N7451_009492 [Penicillium sp. IBT 35674x]
MHLTILSRRIPALNEAQFRHEFRVVHAEQTISIAQNLGIIHQYEQGLALQTLKQSSLDRSALLPLEEAPKYDAFARLTWPRLEVMQGSFTTEDYRRTAGEHVFAEPFQIFLTEPLSTEATRQIAKDSVSEEDIIRVIIPIQHSANGVVSDTEFEERWNQHASFISSTGAAYTRHRSLDISPDQLARIFDQTQFDYRLVVARGGYEELLFHSRAPAEKFFKQYAKEMRDSYDRFVDPALELFIYDHVMQFAAEQRGWWQVGVGLAVGTALRMKIFMGA